jgi:uncharacterized protein
MTNRRTVMHKLQNKIQIKKIKIVDPFWAKKIEMISKEVIPYQWDILNDNLPDVEPSHAVENFRIAAGEKEAEFYGMVFQDSDVAKWIEAASYSLKHHPDPEIEKYIDHVIDIMEKAQQPGGYLNTYYIVAKPEEKWTHFAFGHELYCAGHLIEAAVAYYNTTGKDKLLHIMSRFADYIDSLFGPEKTKQQKYPGHEEIELALIKLYHVTGEKRYLQLSKYFIDERGRQPSFLAEEPSFGNHKDRTWFDLEYHQAHAPVRDQKEVTGHAVRAMYLYTAMADLVLETGDKELLNALKTLWNNMTAKRMYITGGLGSQGFAERFTFDYDLPNDRSYTETCASIGLLFWSSRMLLIENDSRYADVFERVLYNGSLSGISWDGKKYFYVNPLEIYPEAVEKRYDHSHVKGARQPWYGCACCPPNIARLITSIDTYLYSINDDTLYIHHYMSNMIDCEISGNTVRISQTTNYPWEGNIKVRIDSECGREFTVALRVPGWCGNYTCKINNETIAIQDLEKGYIKLRRTWEKDDTIELYLEMKIECIQAHPKVRDNRGTVALQRGPVVYCLEEVDNGKDLAGISLAADSALEAEYDADYYGGMVLIKGTALRSDEDPWKNKLYQPIQNKTKEVRITAVPYFTWANREPGEMLIWIRYR